MKKISISLFSLMFSLSLFAQNNQPLENLPNLPKQEANNPLIGKLSPSTSFLLLDLKAKDESKTADYLSDHQLQQNYPVITQNGKLYLYSSVLLSNNFSASDFEAMGVIVSSQRGNTNYYSCLIPLDRIEQFAQNPAVKYIESGEKAYPVMDSARLRTNVHRVHQGDSLPQRYKGEGVVVGIIDIGFDFTHPNFYDSTGSTYRVKRIWDQNNSGTPPSGYNYGRELTTTAAMLAAKRDLTTEDHGSHVAGIAGGSGGGGGLPQYEGVASKSDLVFVATDGFSNKMMDGIAYIQNYAQSVGKPCVINLSWGGHTGPHDGTSYFDRMVDDVYTGRGRIIIGAAGNEGRVGNNIHLSKTYTSTDTSVYTLLRFPSSSFVVRGETTVDIWGEPSENFYAAAHIYNANTGQIISSTPFLYSGASSYSNSVTLLGGNGRNCSVGISSGRNAVNNKPNVRFSISYPNQNDTNRYVMIEVRGANTKTKMWTTRGVFYNRGNSAPFMSGTNTSTVGEVGGTGNSTISVGAYTTKRSWKSYTGGTWTNNATVGGKADFSSMGPTADGRVKPDISAPGQTIASSVNSYSNSYTSSGSSTVGRVYAGTTNWWFGVMQGTSMAAPVVTGIVALWLQMDSTLTPDRVKTILKDNAIKDNFTGNITTNGSNIWGHGKVNAWVNLTNYNPQAPVVTPATSDICIGDSVVLTAPIGYTAYLWNTGATTRTIKVGATGTYKVKVTDSFNTDIWSNDVTVNVHNNPPAINLGNDTGICLSDAIILRSGNTDPTATVLWSNAAQTDNITVNAAGAYFVTVTSQYGCTTASDTVYISNLPSPANFDFGNDTTICNGDNFTLSVPPLNSNENVLWNDNSTNRTLKITQTGYYFALVRNNSGCSTSDTIHIIVNPSPVVNLGGDQSICGTSGVTFTYNKNNPTDSVLWSDNTNGNSIYVTQPGQYYITVSNTAGCVASDTVNVTKGDAPYTSGISAIYQNNNSLLFSAEGVKNVNRYHWDFGDGDSSNLQTPYHTYANKGSYFVTLTVRNSCGSHYVTKVVEYYPTPSGIENNSKEELKVFPNPAREYVTIQYKGNNNLKSIVIYNILGQVVYQGKADRSQDSRIDVRHFASGIYQTKLMFDNGKWIQKEFEIRK